MTYSLKMFLWIEQNGVPADFLDYPAGVVDEVMHLQQVAPEIASDVEASNKRMEEWQKKAAGLA